MKYRTTAFETLRENVLKEYRESDWTAGKRWLARVGLPRITADVAAAQASGLLDSINLSTHRNDPELADLLVAAREATSAYYRAVLTDNWARFEGRTSSDSGRA